MRHVTIVAVSALILGGCQVGQQKNEHNKRKTENQQGGQSGRGVVVVNVDGSDPNHQPDHTITVPKVVLNQTAPKNDANGMKNEKPKGMTPAQVKANQTVQQALALKDLLPLNLPFAAPSERGCRTSFVRNYSSRNGVAAHLIVIHWTGSANTGNWNDVNAIAAWFDQARAQASSNYTIDSGGRCIYLVPEQLKAWTQAAANPFSVSIEVVHPGGPNERFCPGACLRKLGQVVYDISRRWRIPLRRGATRNCAPTRSGIIDHKSLGACGGGHPDIGSFSLSPIISEAQHFAKVAPHAYRPTVADRTTCRKLNYWRTHGRKRGRHLALAVRRKHALAKRGVVCTAHGPLRTRKR